MYCVHCGKEIEDNSNFCPFCGTKVYVKDIDLPKKLNENKKEIDDAVLSSSNNDSCEDNEYGHSIIKTFLIIFVIAFFAAAIITSM